MNFEVKDMDIATGGILVAILNHKDASDLDLHSGDRVLVKCKRRETICILDISESSRAVPKGKIGLFEEVLKKLRVKKGSTVSLEPSGKPESVAFIRKKLHGEKLSAKELYMIVDDITHDRLTDVEKTYFVSATFSEGLSMHETVDLTKAMVDTGDKLKFKGITLDKHCIGGVPGNRTTMVVVPIIAAAGFTIPKTSSRAITSPAGTADTMECLAKVEVKDTKIKKIVSKVGACIVHGGSMNLAPADDKIIEVEHPLSIDAEGQLLASVMAKKYSVTANHVLIDIPVGKEVKAKTRREANHLKRKFEHLGKKLGMSVKVILTDGSSPIGNGIGPLLEADDVLSVLRNDPKAPEDLREKSLYMAGILLEMAGKKNGRKLAQKILDSGKALKKMEAIIAAQGRQKRPKLGKNCYTYHAKKSGKVTEINNAFIAKIARVAGAPEDKGAGIYLSKKVKDKVDKGEVLFTIFAESKFKLDLAVEFAKKNKSYLIG